MGLGQSVRLASVRCLTLPSRRKDSRRRIHGGELRLATVSMYMAIKRAQIDIKSKIKIHIYMATYLCQKTRESSIEAIQRTIAQSKFSLGGKVGCFAYCKSSVTTLRCSREPRIFACSMTTAESSVKR